MCLFSTPGGDTKFLAFFQSDVKPRKERRFSFPPRKRLSQFSFAQFTCIMSLNFLLHFVETVPSRWKSRHYTTFVYPPLVLAPTECQGCLLIYYSLALFLARFWVCPFSHVCGVQHFGVLPAGRCISYPGLHLARRAPERGDQAGKLTGKKHLIILLLVLNKAI